MNFIIFIILSIIYLYLLFKVYSETKSFNCLKISLVLFILQSLSYIGHFMSGDYIGFYSYNNFIQFLGQLTSDIAQNWLVIISLIIVIIKYKSINNKSFD